MFIVLDDGIDFVCVVVDAQMQAAQQRQLEADKADFAACVVSSTRAAEGVAARMLEEKQRLSKVKEDMAKEKISLEQRRVAVITFTFIHKPIHQHWSWFIVY